MARGFRTSRRSHANPPQATPNGHIVHVDNESLGNLLEFIRLDYVRDASGNWVTRPSSEPVTQTGDEYSKYSFSILREWDWEGLNYTPYVNIRNQALKQALQSIMGEVEGLSWNEFPLKIVPQTLLMFYPKFMEHIDRRPLSDASKSGDRHLGLLVKYLESEHGDTLKKIQNLLLHEEITFDLMWCLFVPQTIFFQRCSISREARALRLTNSNKESDACGRVFWNLTCEYTEASGLVGDAETPEFGRAEITIRLPSFKGTKKIDSLSAFPLVYHADEEVITEKLVSRGMKWMLLNGMHHKRYDGIAYSYFQNQPKVTVSSRIMVDKSTYKRMNPNDWMPDVKVFVERESPDPLIVSHEERGPEGNSSLTREQLLLSTPLVYGFSLSDKMWLVFNVNLIAEILWQEDAFDNLVLPDSQKSLIKALVESHSGPEEDGFDDFIMGKGRGLIINLFGPPGVGKTLSAEATSEYVRRPLYVVGIGEIGRNVEGKLKEIFDVASVWKALVLIDEADVFMEQRSVHDLDRNALVAVFLRKLEYYQGILFLTTNRVKVFDEAFQSRIHISLRYQELDSSAKRQIWAAFFKKASMDTSVITKEQWDKLSNAQVNGRQIKNAVRSCQGLAISRRQPLMYEHIEEVLAVMEQFEADFKAEKGYRNDEDGNDAKRRKLGD